LIATRGFTVKAVLLGAVLGVASAFLAGTRYSSRMTLVAATAGGGGDARVRGLASQLGLGDLGGLTGGGQAASPAFVVQLTTSPVVLHRLAADSVVVPELGGTSPRAIVDLLDPRDEGSADDSVAAERRRRDVARRLTRLIKVWQIRETGSVRFEVTTPWASVSYALAQRLVRILNDVNLEIGRRQAEQERRFVEGRLAEREGLVRSAERRLEEFLRTNRDFRNSASLTFEHDRLQRDLALQQQLRASLAQSLEDVRIREVRDVAVLNAVEPPLLALERDSRGTLLRGLAGAVTGVLVGVAVALWPVIALGGTEADGEDAARFRSVLSGALPARWRQRIRD
jgi:uncharacterized protein involved in exopolysaccharide biosynthesis